MTENIVQKFLLQDQAKKGSIEAIVEISSQGISIGFTGYGEYTSRPGEGRPIHIEFHNGHPKVYIWGDINEEEPTEIHSLVFAHESKREDEPE